MKRLALLLLVASAALAGCDRTPDQPAETQIPPPPTLAATEALVLPTLPPADTAAPQPAEPTAGPTEPPTSAPEATATATVPPVETATAEPAIEASPTTAAGNLFAPGDVSGGTLPLGGATSYLVQGRRFQPLILFVEPENQLDAALAVYSGDYSGQTTPQGATPLVSADNALAGRPEILVLSPEADGPYTFVLRAASGEGNYVSYLYDLTTPAPGMAVQQPDLLAAGTEKVYSVTSRGPRPVIAVADPTDQSDIALDILDANGVLLTSANYSGAGGVETAYVLPLGTTTYSVKIREANGGPSAFQIAIIALE